MASPFAKTTLGPPAPTGVDTSKGALLGDVQNGIVEAVDALGNTHGLETSLLALVNQTALTNVTTAQNLVNKTFPAFIFNKVGRQVQISGQLIFTTTNAATFTIALVLGGVTLCSIAAGAATAAAITNGQILFSFLFSVVTTGAAATIESHGSISVQLSGTLSTALPQYADQNTAVSSAVNLTAAAALQITIAASSSVSSVQMRQFLIEVLN